MPEDKNQKIAELQKEDKRIALVGKGVNDVHTLLSANVGLRLGAELV